MCAPIVCLSESVGFTSYCSAECQKEDWEKHNHKQRCEQLQQDAAGFGDATEYNKAFRALSEAGNATIAHRLDDLAALYVAASLQDYFFVLSSMYWYYDSCELESKSE